MCDPGSTINGAGNLGNGSLQILNKGLIDANSPGTLAVNPGTAGVLNENVMQASNGGTLYLTGGTFDNTGVLIQSLSGSTVQLGNGTFVNARGTIQALDASVVQLLNGSTVSGGTLGSQGSGYFLVPQAQSATLLGTIISGRLTFSPYYGDSTLLLGGTTLLTGSGSITLAAVPNWGTTFVSGSTPTSLLMCDPGSTINGAGNLGNGSLQILNKGLIDANSPGTLAVNPGTAGVLNENVMQASNGGTLYLTGGTFDNTGVLIQSLSGSTVQLGNGTFVNARGTIQALDGSVVQLLNGSTVSGGTLGSQGSGYFLVPQAQSATLLGTIISGRLTFSPYYGDSTLLLGGTTLLTGSGSITLAAVPNWGTTFVSGSTPTSLLMCDPGSTINGAGNLGNGSLQILNKGLIDANSPGTLAVNPGTAGVLNENVMQASNGGTLYLTGGTFDNTGVLIQSLSGSTVQLGNGTFVNARGTIQALDASVVQLLNGSTVSGGTLGSQGSGYFQVPSGQTTSLVGTVIDGRVVFNSYPGDSHLLLGGTTLLTGSGSMALAVSNGWGTTNVSGTSSTSLLICDTGSSIYGGGNLGNGSLQILNKGLVDANQAGGTLVVSPGTAGLVNQNVMQASNSGTLLLTGGSFDNTGCLIQSLSGSTVQFSNGSFTNTGGTIQAWDGSLVQLLNGTIISGGTLSSVGTGYLQVPSGAAATLLGTEINGTLTFRSYPGSSTLLLGGTTLLTGSGSMALTVSNGWGTTNVSGTSSTSLLICDTGSSIYGGGNLGNGSLQILNKGLVDANQAGGTLVVSPGTAGLVNQNVMQASNSGTLLLTGGSFDNTGCLIQSLSGSTVQFSNGSFTNTGGTIQAWDGSLVQLLNGTIISGGTLSSVGTGYLQVPSGAAATLLGTEINGTLTFRSYPGSSTLLLGGTTLLTGSGSMALTVSNGWGTTNVSGTSSTSLLICDTGSSIYGGGNLGNGSLQILNKGLVDANQAGGTLVVSPGTAGLVNQNVMQASNSGTLLLTDGSFDNTNCLIQAIGQGTVQFSNGSFANTGGTIQALAGSAVQFYNNTTITGGTLLSANTGYLQIPGNNATVTLNGTVINGNLGVNGNDTLLLSGTTLLTGSNSLTLASGNAVVTGTAATSLLICDTGSTIGGWGSLGNGSLQILNKGLINANQDGAWLGVNPGPAGLVNQGIMQASNGGTLYLADGTFTNNGLIQTINGGSMQFANITLTGSGTLRVNGGNTIVFGSAGSVSVNFQPGALIDIESGTLQGSSNYNGHWAGNQASLYVAPGATFNGAEANINIDALNGAGSVMGGYSGTQVLTVGVANGSGSFTGSIADTGLNGSHLALVKTGSGTQILTGSNSYTGGTTISAGVLQLGAQAAVPDNSPLTITGGTLDLGGFTKTTSAAVSFQGGVTENGTIINNGAAYDGQAGTVLASLQGSAGLNKTSYTILTLGNANTYTGPTTISAGTLVLNNAAALQSSTAIVTLDNSLQFNTNNGAIGTFNVGGLTGSGAINLADGINPITLSVGGNGASTTYTARSPASAASPRRAAVR